jgi:uridylate kinase
MRLVMRIGGSVIASPVNPALICEYVSVLEHLKKQGHEVAAVVGGGALAREFIGIARDLGLTEEAQDELAISVSRLFAQLFLGKLGSRGCGAVPIVVETAAKCLRVGKIVVMGGLKPGMTTDTVAALISERIRADLFVKATDQDGVYDKDPRTHDDAVKLDHMSFSELSRIFTENKHKAGIHQILDPEAVKLLKKGKVKVVVVNGGRPENVLAAVQGKQIGTLIE